MLFPPHLLHDSEQNHYLFLSSSSYESVQNTCLQEPYIAACQHYLFAARANHTSQLFTKTNPPFVVFPVTTKKAHTA